MRFNGHPTLRRRLIDIVLSVWRGGVGAAAVKIHFGHGTLQKEGSERVRQLQGSFAGSPRRQDIVEDHRSSHQ